MFLSLLPTRSSDLVQHAAAILHADTAVQAYATCDTAVAQLTGRAYTTILALEVGSISRRVFSSVPHVYPVGVAKELGPSAWRSHVVDAGRVFVAANPADIRASFPDPEVVAGLGATCLVNVPITGPGHTTIGLFNIAAVEGYDLDQLGVLALLGQLVGPALLRAISNHDGRP